MTKKIKWKRILIAVIILGIGIFIYNKEYNTNNVRGGKLLEELNSPNGKYIAKSYVMDGGPITADSTRVEIVNNKTKKVKNIYFNYPEYEDEIKIKWIDNETIKINDKKLNVLKDSYNWRRSW